MSEKKVRITKVQRFEDIKALLTGEPVTYGTTVDIAVTVIDHELELLAKKNSSTGDKKLTPTQQENEALKEQIVEYLSTLPDDTDGVTCTEILKSVPALTDFSNQKVAALVRQLKMPAVSWLRRKRASPCSVWPNPDRAG